ncbi:MAG: hypothetical protein K8F92_01440, partial [Hyphomicrobium sp.]|uniref:hypothetical protein n=1 Tax=Hyphomicrobium sp. TaxID=82 RepID=UPI0025B97E5C
MRDENVRTAASGRGVFAWRPFLLCALAWLAAVALVAPASAQRPDDSYKGPSPGGGLDAQMRQFEAPPPAAGGGGGG